MPSTSPGIQPKALGDFVFAAARRPSAACRRRCRRTAGPLAHRFVQRVDHAGHRVEAAPAIRRRRRRPAAPRGRRARDRVGIAGDHDRLIVPALARRALERLRGRVQIARAVIDDGDAHRALRLAETGRSRRTSTAPRRDGGRRRARSARSTAAAAAPRADARPSRSKKRRSASSQIVADHDADVAPAPRGAASSAAACPLRADQERDQQADHEAAPPPGHAQQLQTPILHRDGQRHDRATSTSHSRRRSIHSGPNRNAQKWKPSRTNTNALGDRRTARPSSACGWCTV